MPVLLPPPPEPDVAGVAVEVGMVAVVVSGDLECPGFGAVPDPDPDPEPDPVPAVGTGVERVAGVFGVAEVLGEGVELGLAVGVAVAVAVGVGVAVAVGVGVGVAVGVAVGVGVAVAVGVGVGAVIVAPFWSVREQAGWVIWLLSSVTAPLRARRRPSTVAPATAVIEVLASTLPMKLVAEPSVAEEPTCQ